MGFDARVRKLRRLLRYGAKPEAAIEVAGFKLPAEVTPAERWTRQVRKSARKAGFGVVTEEQRQAEREERARLARAVTAAKAQGEST